MMVRGGSGKEGGRKEGRAHLNENEIELVEVDLLSPHLGLVRRRLDDHTNDEVPDT